MATTRLTANRSAKQATVEKVADALTNQEYLTDIINKSVEIENQNWMPTVEIAGMILTIPEGISFVQWLTAGKGLTEESVASAIASLLIAARISPAKLAKLELLDNTMPPPHPMPRSARVLAFNPQGKAIEYFLSPSTTGHAASQWPNGAA